MAVLDVLMEQTEKMDPFPDFKACCVLSVCVKCSYVYNYICLHGMEGRVGPALCCKSNLSSFNEELFFLKKIYD